jgi:hypothetical protein
MSWISSASTFLDQLDTTAALAKEDGVLSAVREVVEVVDVASDALGVSIGAGDPTDPRAVTRVVGRAEKAAALAGEVLAAAPPQRFRPPTAAAAAPPPPAMTTPPIDDPGPSLPSAPLVAAAASASAPLSAAGAATAAAARATAGGGDAPPIVGSSHGDGSAATAAGGGIDGGTPPPPQKGGAGSADAVPQHMGHSMRQQQTAECEELRAALARMREEYAVAVEGYEANLDEFAAENERLRYGSESRIRHGRRRPLVCVCACVCVPQYCVCVIGGACGPESLRARP